MLWALFSFIALSFAAEPFGHGMRAHFMMSPTTTNLNNGAFGTGSRVSYEAVEKYNKEMEANCNHWFRGGYQPLLVKARERLAQYVHTNVEDLVIVENASSGANSVLRSLADNLPLHPGDKVMFLNVVYPMVRNVMDYISKERGLIEVIVNITFPLSSPDQVLKPLADAIAANPGIKVASLDHISSYPAAILPIKQMVKLCKDAGIFVLVDGAHALGQVPLDISDIGASAYITNLHKWAYNPKSACVLHVEKKWQPFILPNIISSEFTGDFATRYQYTGTLNYNSFLAIPYSLDFRESIGGDGPIMSYMHDLAWNSANKVAAIWKTSLIVSSESMVPAMSLVALPTNDPAVVGRVRSVLADKYDTWIQTGNIVTKDGVNTQYIRISAQVYLEESDILLMAHRFLEIMNN